MWATVSGRRNKKVSIIELKEIVYAVKAVNYWIYF